MLERLGVVDVLLGLALGRRVGMARGGRGRVWMLDRPADRTVVADRQRTGELGRHPGDPAFAYVEQVLAEVEQATHRRGVVDGGELDLGLEPAGIGMGRDHGPDPDRISLDRRERPLRFGGGVQLRREPGHESGQRRRLGPSQLLVALQCPHRVGLGVVTGPELGQALLGGKQQGEDGDLVAEPLDLGGQVCRIEAGCGRLGERSLRHRGRLGETPGALVDEPGQRAQCLRPPARVEPGGVGGVIVGGCDQTRVGGRGVADPILLPCLRTSPLPHHAGFPGRAQGARGPLARRS